MLSRTSHAFARHAFSMVELSIVLVILVLLVGGVLSGKSLIKSAELRSVLRDFDRYQSAVLAFRDKYQALPGDMPNAVRFWGAQAGATTDGKDAICAALTTVGTGTATCNGDGDGMIDYDNDGGFPPEDDSMYEVWRAWQHLSNTGLIEGRYTGVAINALYAFAGYSPGVNAPRGRMNNSFWTMWRVPANRTWSPTPGVNYMVFGSTTGPDPDMALRWHNPVLTPEDQWNIDTKLDDGKPYTGRVMDTSTTNTPDCTTSETYATAQYNMAYTSLACVAMFRVGF